MFEILIIILGIIALVLLWINNDNQRNIYNKLWQLHEITNAIHTLLRDSSDYVEKKYRDR